ncbi:MAG: hypothetical protein RBS72_04785 [Sedimentisphaerales bacterium]|jgi:hypothetical protein|nr:hypothetical protein [Sedimentisphaerales bacterium]HNY77516.1 hypothetical protein [Sedimentisphaerales bacterium]HOC62920.1 hypothetical protein [Sedimentisphaerales bacterium]HOH63594.1 hypothetical protein [Sedimentisphaerales bacterium]HPY48629.1 hypothetical protein [Sedimentisphaerales bacterium]
MAGLGKIYVFCIVLLAVAGSVSAARPSFGSAGSDDRWGQTGVFFREHWAEFDATISNSSGRMLRVNDAELSLHPEHGRRPEARANGLTLIDVPEDLFALQGADLYLEVWGGHPKTANKRFLLNGKQVYAIPDDGCEAGHCAYSYPLVSLKVEQLVSGRNAVQFACDRGQTFWGHFIVDEAAIRGYLKPGHPDLVARGLEGFSARVLLPSGDEAIGDEVSITLTCPKPMEAEIESVECFARYDGYDDDGDGQTNDWHGYTHDRRYVHHIGKATAGPFPIVWDTRMIPDQDGPMALRALVRLKGGLCYWTPVLDGLEFARGRHRVQMYACRDMPVPFWSRASQVRTATIDLPQDLSDVESARLIVRIWDGGEGNVKEPFKINGHSYSITSSRAVHDVVHTDVEVDPSHLKSGPNTLTLLSDTEHHGIEVLLPGPCLVVRYDNSRR